MKMPELPGPPKVGSAAPPLKLEPFRGDRALRRRPPAAAVLLGDVVRALQVRAARSDGLRGGARRRGGRGDRRGPGHPERDSSISSSSRFPQTVAIDPFRATFQSLRGERHADVRAGRRRRRRPLLPHRLQPAASASDRGLGLPGPAAEGRRPLTGVDGAGAIQRRASGRSPVQRWPHGCTHPQKVSEMCHPRVADRAIHRVSPIFHMEQRRCQDCNLKLHSRVLVALVMSAVTDYPRVSFAVYSGA